MNRLCVLLLATSALSVRAGDESSLDVIGFSSDGKALAFERSGVQDGSGAAYSEIFFVDVLKNDFLQKPVVVVGDGEGDSSTTVRARAKSLAAKATRKYGIVSGKLGNALEFERGAKPDAAGFVRRTVATPDGDSLQFVLKQTRAEGCDDARMFELDLALEDVPFVIAMQHDTKLPRSRGCVSAYRLRAAWQYESSIAVFLDIEKPGYEGDDLRQMVVTTGDLTLPGRALSDDELQRPGFTISCSLDGVAFDLEAASASGDVTEDDMTAVFVQGGTKTPAGLKPAWLQARRARAGGLRSVCAGFPAFELAAGQVVVLFAVDARPGGPKLSAVLYDVRNKQVLDRKEALGSISTRGSAVTARRASKTELEVQVLGDAPEGAKPPLGWLRLGVSGGKLTTGK